MSDKIIPTGKCRDCGTITDYRPQVRHAKRRRGLIVGSREVSQRCNECGGIVDPSPETVTEIERMQAAELRKSRNNML